MASELTPTDLTPPDMRRLFAKYNACNTDVQRNAVLEEIKEDYRLQARLYREGVEAMKGMGK